MGRLYVITRGQFATTDEDGKPVTKNVGDEIELDEDVAAAHADRVALKPADDGAQTSAQDA